LQQATIETGIPVNSFPAECPYSLQQILNQDLQAD
jgi:hypothetical protein